MRMRCRGGGRGVWGVGGGGEAFICVVDVQFVLGVGGKMV